MYFKKHRHTIFVLHILQLELTIFYDSELGFSFYSLEDLIIFLIEFLYLYKIELYEIEKHSMSSAENKVTITETKFRI